MLVEMCGGGGGGGRVVYDFFGLSKCFYFFFTNALHVNKKKTKCSKYIDAFVVVIVVWKMSNLGTFFEV